MRANHVIAAFLLYMCSHTQSIHRSHRYSIYTKYRCMKGMYGYAMASQAQSIHNAQHIQHTHHKYIYSNDGTNSSHTGSIGTDDVLHANDVLHINYREVLGSNVVPQHYDLRIKIMDAGFSGAVGIAIDIKNATRSIVLNAAGLDVSVAKIVAGGRHHTGVVHSGMQLDVRDQIRIEFAEHVKGPAYILLQFSGAYATGLRGLYCSNACTSNGNGNDNLNGRSDSIGNDRSDGTDDVGIQPDKQYMHDADIGTDIPHCSRVYCTHFEPSDARRMFPCFDQPDLKATFSISVDVPKTLTVLSNTDTVPEWREDYGNRKIEYFERTCRMATYVVAIVAGSLDYVQGVSSSGIRVRVYGIAGVSDKRSRMYALGVALRSVEYFGEYFGMRYVSCGSSAKIDMVGVPEFGAGAMENWGLVVYRTENLEVMAVPASAIYNGGENDREVVDEDKSMNAVDGGEIMNHNDVKNSIRDGHDKNISSENGNGSRDSNGVFYGSSEADEDNMQQIRETVSHEIAHMWFGNLVTLRWWDELWVNEGFATWASLKYLQEAWGADEELRFVKDRLASSMRDEGDGRAVRDRVVSGASAAGRFDSVRYGKSASVIRMVEQYVGPDVMREGIREYLERHKYGNVSGSDVWKAVSECWRRMKGEDSSADINDSGTSSGSGAEISQMVREWMEQEGYPVVHVHEEDGEIVLAQSRYCSARMGVGASRVHGDTNSNSNSNEEETVNEVGNSRNDNGMNGNGMDRNGDDAGCDAAKHLWRIPVSIMWDNGSMHTVLLSTPEMRVARRTQRYKLNAGYAGYFRVHYGLNGGVLHALMVAGDSEVDQANVIEDVFELAYAGYMSVGAVMREVLSWGTAGPWRWSVQQMQCGMETPEHSSDGNDNSNNDGLSVFARHGIEMLNGVKTMDSTDGVNDIDGASDGMPVDKTDGKTYEIAHVPDNVVKGVVGKLLVVWGELYEDVEVRQVLERAIWGVIGRIVKDAEICVDAVESGNETNGSSRKSDWNTKSRKGRVNGHDGDCKNRAGIEMQKYALEVGVMMGRKEAVEKARSAYERGMSRMHMPAMVGALADEQIKEMMQKYAGAGKEWRKWVVEGMSGLMQEESVKYVLDEVCRMSRLCLYMDSKCEDSIGGCVNGLKGGKWADMNSSEMKNAEVSKEQDNVSVLSIIAGDGVINDVDATGNVMNSIVGEVLHDGGIGIADVVDILRGIWRGGKFRETIAEYVLRMWGAIQKAAGMNGMILRDAAEMVGGIRDVSVGVKYGDEQKGKDWELAGTKVIEEIRFRERLRERRDEILSELMALFDTDGWRVLESKMHD
ncbi:peptidase [Ordospora pajunii]|uniref:peptidase n=1 Tax=Ordospora pajunii TaxID=3039483 RepID=UPI0029529278|nr:peptidase [Ordospora pajunii]KAH9410533.1 peptidase [Ordospora pajunii]